MRRQSETHVRFPQNEREMFAQKRYRIVITFPPLIRQTMEDALEKKNKYRDTVRLVCHLRPNCFEVSKAKLRRNDSSGNDVEYFINAIVVPVEKKRETGKKKLLF